MRARRRALAREIVQTSCVLVVVSGAWVCAFARLGRFAPWPFLANSCDLLNTLLAPVLIAMAAASLLAAAMRRALGLGLAAIAGAMALWQSAAVLADAAPRAEVEGTPIRVLTVNAFHDNGDPTRLRAVIEGAAPDIVMVEESDGRAGHAILRTLPMFHRVDSCPKAPCSLTILSRWPARRIPTPMPPERELPDVLFAQVAFPGRPITVVAVHLPRGYRPVAAHYRRLLIDAVHRVGPARAIVGGDFNLPTGGAALAKLPAGTGLHRADRWIATYPANRAFPAFAPIDHLFVAPAFGVRGCRRLPFSGSDHFGIGCDIVVPPR